jgi:hypothetical protein
MQLQTLITNFQTILNRDDCSQAQAIIFITEGMTRITREARLPCMERLLVQTSTAPCTAITLPPDFLECIDVFVQSADPGCWFNPYLPDGITLVPDVTYVPLAHLSYRQLLRVSSMDVPKAYARFQAQLQIRGAIPANVETQVSYYGEFTPLATLTSANELTCSAPDLAQYAALSFAGDYFSHPQTQQWEARYQSLLGAVENLSVGLEMNGGPLTVQSAYGDY